MRRLLSIIIAVCAVAFVGCQADYTAEVVGGENSLTISLEDTRVSFGEKNNGQYPLNWSEGDRIVVNGVRSNSAQIDEQNKCRATFEFSTAIEYPFNVTYPHCNTTTATQPVVEFKSEQNYTVGSFDKESLPICGYQASKSSKLTMSHITGVVRFPVISTFEGAVLKKIVITSTSNKKLAGAFNVTCSLAKIAPRQYATNSVTYYLPNNFTLSKSEESVFYISLPAINVGTCTIDFIESNGEKMTAIWDAGAIAAGKVREFSTIKYKRGVAGSLNGFEIEEDYIITDGVSGYVRDDKGRPIEGVAVSDGFVVAITNALGYYALEPSKDAWYIYLTVPAEYEIPIKDGMPCFYQRYNKSQKRYDFTLKPLAGGKEEKFALFAFGDPQLAIPRTLEALRDDVIPAIKSHVSEVEKEMPCYGITLGDLISTNSVEDRTEYREPAREQFKSTNVGLPVFHIMGNHDNKFFNTTYSLEPDEYSSDFQLKAQREHEDMFGPINFSFDRGDMHIICMRNIIYKSNTDCSPIRGFFDYQLDWLKQDLANVPKDKRVVLCVHIPIEKYSGNNVKAVRYLLNEYEDVHILSGHSHIIKNYEHTVWNSDTQNIYEHTLGSLCGAWWTSRLCGDGSPLGYAVFTVENGKFTDWYYIGCYEGMNTREHQMRLYRGNAVFGADKPTASGTNVNKTKGYYGFDFGSDVLLANVYMADSKWQIKVYENGKYSGDMEHVGIHNGVLAKEDHYRRPAHMANTEVSGEYLTGDGTFTSPFISNVVTSADMFYTGLFNGVLGRPDNSSGSRQGCFHLYKYTLKNPNATIKVEAIDRFGRTYTETHITDNDDILDYKDRYDGDK